MFERGLRGVRECLRGCVRGEKQQGENGVFGGGGRVCTVCVKRAYRDVLSSSILSPTEDILGSNVGGEDDDGVAKVHHVALGIGQSSIVQ